MKKWFIVAILLAALVSACTQIELCPEEEHPHPASVSFTYDWSQYQEYGSSIPDSMAVILNKVIRTKKTMLGLETANNTGKYDSIPEWLPEEENHDISTFKISEGEYKFMTINRKNTDIIYPELDHFMKDTAQVHGFGDVWIEYQTYEKNSSYLEKPHSEWTDHNTYRHEDGTYAQYIRPDMFPLCVDTTGVSKINAHEERTIAFKPKMLSQNIDIYFDIKKELGEIDFTVDSIYCVISGVPHSMNISSGRLNIASTDKMIYKGILVDPNVAPSRSSSPIEDSFTSNKVRCYKNVNVTGIVENEEMDANIYNGPGVFQTIIYTRVYEKDKEPRTKIVNGIVNIHNSIKEAKLQEFDLEKGFYHKTKDHNTLYIKIDATITQSYLKGSDNGGIDYWTEIKVEGNGDDGGHDIY